MRSRVNVLLSRLSLEIIHQLCRQARPLLRSHEDISPAAGRGKISTSSRSPTEPGERWARVAFVEPTPGFPKEEQSVVREFLPEVGRAELSRCLTLGSQIADVGRCPKVQ